MVANELLEGLESKQLTYLAMVRSAVKAHREIWARPVSLEEAAERLYFHPDHVQLAMAAGSE